MEDNVAKVAQMKDRGNACLEAGNLKEAVSHYSKAIEIDPENHVLYSNRSAAYAKLGQYRDALNDAEKVLLFKPDWAKGYSRKGAALAYLGQLSEAMAAYQKGLQLDPNNQQLKDGLAECRSKIAQQGGGRMLNPFHDPNFMEHLKEDPRTKEFMKDPEFVKTMQELSTNPQALGTKLNDKRILTTLSVLMGMEASTDDDDVDPSPPPPKKNTTVPSKEENMEVDKTPEQLQV